MNEESHKMQKLDNEIRLRDKQIYLMTELIKIKDREIEQLTSYLKHLNDTIDKSVERIEQIIKEK